MAKANKTSSYQAEDIKVLEGLDGGSACGPACTSVHRKPRASPYLWEIVDNATDEAANGYADR